MKKKFIKICMPLVLFLLAIIGITALKKENKEKYEEFDCDEIVLKKSNFSGGLWHTDKYSYKYKLNLAGTLPKAEEDIVFVVLSNSDLLTFEDVSESIFNKKSKTDEEDFVLIEIKKI